MFRVEGELGYKRAKASSDFEFTQPLLDGFNAALGTAIRH